MQTKILEKTQEDLIKILIEKLDDKSALIVHKIVELEHKITKQTICAKN
jgi:hypothetical protein